MWPFNVIKGNSKSKIFETAGVTPHTVSLVLFFVCIIEGMQPNVTVKSVVLCILTVLYYQVFCSARH
jgi:hypothetical protein